MLQPWQDRTVELVQILLDAGANVNASDSMIENRLPYRLQQLEERLSSFEPYSMRARMSIPYLDLG